VRSGETIYDVTAAVGSVAAWLRRSVGRVEEAIAELAAAAQTAERRYPAAQFDNYPGGERPYWLAPVDQQEVWCAGVTYLRSRDARQLEAVDGGDVYARVYDAGRPELFAKASGPRVVGPFGDVGIRRDAAWNVPEPELGLVFNPAMEIVGVVPGNDMSSRDIEGENPLYIPQAKIYDKSCSLGPGILLGRVQDTWPAVSIGVTIERGGRTAFSGATHTERLKRRPAELADYLGRSLSFPDGVVLLTGTGVVPPDSFTLAAGDIIAVEIEGLGKLINQVVVV
jgi:2-dehydro-3-deoxy-D-arabinonate dehydratase